MKKQDRSAQMGTALLFILMPSIGLAGEESMDSASHHSMNAKDEMGNHGMLVVGGRGETGNIYISHLPMFMPPHHFQGIWEITFGESEDKRYRQAQHAVNRGDKPLHPYFTLKPNENFLLRDLGKGKASFRADVFARHFERSEQQPERILSNVEVTIKNEVYFHELGQELGTIKFAEYIVFGSPQERFLAHRITHAPNYDQIVEIASPLIPEAILDGTVIIAFAKADAPDRVLQVREEVQSKTRNIVAGAAPSSSFTFNVLDEYYLEIKELSFDRLGIE